MSNDATLDPMTTETAEMFMRQRDAALADVRRLQQRLEHLTEQHKREITAKDRVIADQERVIVDWENKHPSTTETEPT